MVSVDKTTPTLSGLAPGWTVAEMYATRRNSICALRIDFTAPALSVGNYADISVATLPAGFRPAQPVSVPAASAQGFWYIGTAGGITMTASAFAVTAGSNLRIVATYLLA